VAGLIHYYCSAAHSYTLGIFAAHQAKLTASAIRILPYNSLPLIRAFGPGAHIFTDFERMTAERRSEVARLADALSASGCMVLNHPARTLRRYDLLRALHEAGINDFNAYLLKDWRDVRRYPVFIRHADAHVPTVTDLLQDRGALAREADLLLAKYGEASDLIVVEFGNAQDADGRFRKYSVFRVGRSDYASTCQSSEHWWIKYAPGGSATQREEHLRFVAEDPHRDQLDAVWKVGRADYGRVDYCVVSGRVQAFEINTSPTISYLPEHDVGEHWAAADAQHDEALAKLLADASGTATDNPLRDPARTALRTEDVHMSVLRWGRENWARDLPNRTE
jgi:hypothetical protein